jgi:hypothetical protein
MEYIVRDFVCHAATEKIHQQVPLYHLAPNCGDVADLVHPSSTPTPKDR